MSASQAFRSVLDSQRTVYSREDVLIATASFSTYELDGFFKVRPNLESFSSIVIVTFNWATQERLMCRPSKVSESIWDRISEVFSHLKMRNGI